MAKQNTVLDTYFELFHVLFWFSSLGFTVKQFSKLRQPTKFLADQARIKNGAMFPNYQT